MCVPNWNPGTHSGHRFLFFQQLTVFTTDTWWLSAKSLSRLVGTAESACLYPYPSLYPKDPDLKNSSYIFPKSLCLHSGVPENLAYGVLEKCYWIIYWGNSRYSFGFYAHYWDEKYINTSTDKLHIVWTL